MTIKVPIYGGNLALVGDLDRILSGLESSLSAITQQVVAAAAGLRMRGPWSAASGAFPTGAAVGDSWHVSVAGTVGGESFAVGDQVVALVANAAPTTFAGNWFRVPRQDMAGFTAAVSALDAEVAALTDATTPRRVFQSGLAAYVVDGRDMAPALHVISANGAKLIDVSGMDLYGSYTFLLDDFASTEITFWAGEGGVFEASNGRDGYTDLPAITVTGGESLTITRGTGGQFYVHGAWNIDVIEIGTLRAVEQADGSYTLTDTRSLPTGTTDATFAIAGKTFDYSAAIVTVAIVEDSATARDPIKLRDLSVANKVKMENPNAATLTCQIKIENARLA